MQPKYLLYIAVAAVVLAACLATCNRIVQDGRDKTRMAAQLAAYKDSTHYFQNKYGMEVAERKVVAGTTQEVGQFYDTKQIASLFNTQADLLRSYTGIIQRMQARLDAAGPATAVYAGTPTITPKGDTCWPRIRYMTQEFRNPYYTLGVRVGDSAYADLRGLGDTITVAQYRDYTRHFLSKRWFTKVGVTNSNPYVRDTIIGSFIVEDRMPQSYFDFYVEGAFGQLASPDFRPVIGAEVEYTNKRLSYFANYRRPLSGAPQSFILTGVRWHPFKR